MKCISGLVMAALVSASAWGQITAFNFVNVDNSAGGSALAGSTTTDILIDYNGQWTGSQMLITLEQGSVYIDPLVDPWLGPASVTLQSAVPSTTFATYTTLGAREAEAMPAQLLADVFNFRGGAVNLGGAAAGAIDSNGANAVWSYTLPIGSTTPAEFFDQDDFLVARVTLSDDAQGEFKVLASADGEISITDVGLTIQPAAVENTVIEGVIVNGAFVPEPTSALALAGLSLLVLRRRA